MLHSLGRRAAGAACKRLFASTCAETLVLGGCSAEAAGSFGCERTARAFGSLASTLQSTPRTSQGFALAGADTGAPIRGLKTSNCSAALSFEPAESVQSAKAILHQMNVQELKEQLDALSQSRMFIPVEDLYAMAKEMKVVASDADAEKLVDALDAAGVVMQFRGNIYLRPREMAEVVLCAMPDTVDEIRHELGKLEQELEPMDKQLDAAESEARRRANVYVWLGFAALVSQFAIFVRFTYWEFSWDVMEPMAYFFTQAFGIAAYLYFMITKEDFAYQPIHQRLNNTFRDRAMQTAAFDGRRYEQLQRNIARYKRYLASAVRP